MNDQADHVFESAWQSKAAALLEIQNWPHLKALSDEWLQAAPDSGLAHYYAGWACMSLNQLPRMARHARFLLEVDPDSTIAHDLTCRYWLKSGEIRFALFHAQKLIELAPESWLGYYFGAASTISLKKAGTAIAYIRRARELDPDNALIALLQLRIEHTMVRTGRETRELEARFFEVLRLDPELATSHEALGDFCLADLGDSRRALRSYRIALELDPTDVECQQNFRVAFRQSRWWLRTIYWHQLICSIVIKGVEAQPALLIYALLVSYLTVALVLYLAISAVVFTVPAVFVEAIFFPRTALNPWIASAKKRIGFGRLPLWSQCSIAVGMTAATWASAIAVSRVGWEVGGFWIAATIAVNFALQLLSKLLRRLQLMRDATVLLLVAGAAGIGLLIAWWIGWMNGFEAMLWGIATLILLGVLQVVAISFRLLRRRRNRTVSFTAMPRPPLPG